MQAEVQTVDGAVHMLFLENVIGNAYQNLTNIVLTIRPAELSTEQGVLVASHYDSIIGSPGGVQPAVHAVTTLAEKMLLYAPLPARRCKS